jgi:hypothetical protein
MTWVKTDYRRNPKALLAWGLGPDFNSGGGFGFRFFWWLKRMVKALGFASIVLLSSF